MSTAVARNALIFSAITVAALIYLLTKPDRTGNEIAEEDSLPAGSTQAGAGLIDDERLRNADSESDNWMAYGRTYEEQRFSPLDQINRDTVSRLGLAWIVDMKSSRALEATPIVVDGTMYVSSAWSRGHAFDAVTGEELWLYDPEVPGSRARKACCDVVNRGVAVYRGRVYVASLDGRLIALDAATGEPVWEVDTLIDRAGLHDYRGTASR